MSAECARCPNEFLVNAQDSRRRMVAQEPDMMERKVKVSKRVKRAGVPSTPTAWGGGFSRRKRPPHYLSSFPPDCQGSGP